MSAGEAVPHQQGGAHQLPTSSRPLLIASLPANRAPSTLFQAICFWIHSSSPLGAQDLGISVYTFTAGFCPRVTAALPVNSPMLCRPTWKSRDRSRPIVQWCGGPRLRLCRKEEVRYKWCCSLAYRLLARCVASELLAQARQGGRVLLCGGRARRQGARRPGEAVGWSVAQRSTLRPTALDLPRGARDVDGDRQLGTH